MRLPIAFDWVKYKGETVFAGVNWEATKKAKKPMMDIFYCATEALNNNVIKTVQWDKNKFQPAESTHWYRSEMEYATHDEYIQAQADAAKNFGGL